MSHVPSQGVSGQLLVHELLEDEGSHGHRRSAGSGEEEPETGHSCAEGAVDGAPAVRAGAAGLHAHRAWGQTGAAGLPGWDFKEGL